MNKNILIATVLVLTLNSNSVEAQSATEILGKMTVIAGVLEGHIQPGIYVQGGGYGNGGRGGNCGNGRRSGRRYPQQGRGNGGYVQGQQVYDVVQEWDPYEGRYIPRVRNIRHAGYSQQASYYNNVTTVSVRGYGR